MQLQLATRNAGQTAIIKHVNWRDTMASLKQVYGDEIFKRSEFLKLKDLMDKDLSIISRSIFNEMLKIKTEIMLVRRQIYKMENPIDQFLYTHRCDFIERRVFAVELEYKMLIYLYKNAFRNIERHVI